MAKKKLSEALQKKIPHFAGGGLMGGVSGFLTPQAQGQYGQAATQTSNYGNTIDAAQAQAQAGAGIGNDIRGQQQGLANTFLQQGALAGPSVLNQQQSLANTLLAQSQGQGPNPAQMALNNATGQNIQQQAALMAGQRGASANPALMARQMAQMGAGVQQQAVGQGALMQAQQQLAAQQALQQQQAAMGAQQLSNQQSAANQQQVMGNQNLAQQQASTGLLGTAGQLQNAQNNSAIANMQQANQFNSQQELANAAAMQKTSGGILGALGSSVMGAFGLAKGGAVPLPSHLAGAHNIYHGPVHDYRAGGHVPGVAAVAGNSLKNDTVPAMLSPGEVVLPRSVTQGPNVEKKAVEFLKHLKEVKAKKGKK